VFTLVIEIWLHCSAQRAVGSEPLRRGPRQTIAIVRERRRVPRRMRDAD